MPPRLPVLAALLLLAPATARPASPDTPVGTWRTFSDEDGHETGTVTIAETGGVLSGSVSGIRDPVKQAAHCVKCTDDRRDQPVLGMQILRGVKQDGDVWDGGSILDPENGKTYSVSLRLEQGGERLRVRGYIGISLLGRTQIWQRAQ